MGASSDPTALKRSNVCEAKGALPLRSLQHREGKDEMTKASIDLQAGPEAEDIRQRAKAEPSWRFWGL